VDINVSFANRIEPQGAGPGEYVRKEAARLRGAAENTPVPATKVLPAGRGCRARGPRRHDGPVLRSHRQRMETEMIKFLAAGLAMLSLVAQAGAQNYGPWLNPYLAPPNPSYSPPFSPPLGLPPGNSNPPAVFDWPHAGNTPPVAVPFTRPYTLPAPAVIRSRHPGAPVFD
jgi:hypothetical protein